ncbi:hypothetical protein ACYRFS_12820 [Listeria kieliensis]
MPLDLTNFRNDLFDQILIVIAIVGAVILVVCLLTQNFGRLFGGACVTFIAAGLVFGLKNIDQIGTWLNDNIFNFGKDHAQGGSAAYEAMRYYMKL